MTVFIGVAVLSTAGWTMSLLFSRTAAWRHLVLSTAISACLLLPIALGVRSGTDWTLLAIRSSVNEGEMLARDTTPPSRGQPSEWSLLHPEQTDADAPLPGAGLMRGAVRELTGQNAPSPSLRRQPTVKRDLVSSTTGSQPAPHSVQGSLATTSTWGSARNWGVVAYTLVAVAMLFRLLASLAAVQRVRRRAVEIDTVAGGVRVLEADVACPMAVGFGRPAIVVPHGFRDAVRPDELRDVLAHETEHLRRGDHWVMLLQGITAAVYWPIVTVHLLNRSLARAREELCDNAVLAARDPAAYGQTLLTVARLASGRRTGVAQLSPLVIRRGELERRVAGLLDSRRDRRTQLSRRVSWTVAASLLGLAVLAGTTRAVAVAPPSSASDAKAAEPKATPGPKPGIDWTGIPTVDLENATLHRGVVLEPGGKPAAGASVYAASTIKLLELADADKVGVEYLGPVRAVTDAQGRFEFNAQDLSWVTPAGERKRWETLLVATKEGIAPGWLKTWGEDRRLRSHWHPWKGKEVVVRTRPPATLTGTLLIEGGAPLAGARVRLAGLMAPREYDLDTHVSSEEEIAHGVFGTIDYAETIYRPWLLPGLKTEATTDDNGEFELPGLPEGFIAQIEITHPQAVATSIRVAMRPIEPVYRGQFPLLNQGAVAKPVPKEATPMLYGSRFTAELPKGAVLRGRASFSVGFQSRPASGVIVSRANQNARSGMDGPRFRTDAEGRFEVTGLPDRPQGYELAFVGSYDSPFASRRELVVPGVEAKVTLMRAVPYRLKLTDPAGTPIDREVYSIQVQQTPGSRRQDVKSSFNVADRVAPGVFQGILPRGPAAVLVKRGAATDRPVAVDPKAFFEPGRTDWTAEEMRYAYGDAWRIARPTAVYGSSSSSTTIDQLDLAAVVFTNAQRYDDVLELTGTVHSDSAVEVTLVDDEGKLVDGARVERQLKRYNGKGLPATISVYGLHPERPEILVFTHEQRGLIGTVTTTWTDEPVRVVMKPVAMLTGRIVDTEGALNDNFYINVTGSGIMPDTFVTGRRQPTSDRPGERKGEFRLVVPPGVSLQGEFVRKTPLFIARPGTRPPVGAAFGPVTPKPAETVDLGNLTVP